MAARRDLDDATRTPGSQHEHEWYRFWIIRLEQERTSLQRTLTACENAVVAARAACLTARQRCEALERFREKAYVAYMTAQAARDRKAERYANRVLAPHGWGGGHFAIFPCVMVDSWRIRYYHPHETGW